MTKFTWLEILLFFAPKVSSTAFKALASVGFFRDFDGNISRNAALYEYDIYRTLTKAEHAWTEKNYGTKKWKDFVSCLKDLAPTKKEGGGTHKADRKQIVENEIQLFVWIISSTIGFLCLLEHRKE